MTQVELDMKGLWEVLTMSGKTKALRAIEVHPRLCTSDWDDLPRAVQQQLTRWWANHDQLMESKQ
jgi:hypothetical protein